MKMKIQLGKVLALLLWGGVVAYFGLSFHHAEHRQKTLRLSAIEVEVRDSTAQGFLVTAEEMKGRILKSGLAGIGMPLDKVDLEAVEGLIRENGFIDRAEAYIDPQGCLRLWVTQRKPVLRLLTDGRNCYVTRDGWVFDAPPLSSLNLPLVTGNYQPPFPKGMTGSVRELIDSKINTREKTIFSQERMKDPFYERLDTLKKWRRRICGNYLSQRWWLMESDEDFEKRVSALREKKAKTRRSFRFYSAQVHAQIDKVTEKQNRERQAQIFLEKNYEDFMKLIIFVEQVEEEPFWRSEVVQFVVNRLPNGQLEADLIPRSGSFKIRFGRFEYMEEKFEKLNQFYSKVLKRKGWNNFKEIDVRYSNQIVCRRR